VVKLYVLGVGPGSPDYLTPAVVRAARKCDLLVGGSRNLALFSHLGLDSLEIKGSLQPVFDRIREVMTRRQVGILVSGDAGLYSIMPSLKREFGDQALEVYPGISAAQYMFARIGMSWQDARFISVHGRKIDQLIPVVQNNAVVAVFTDKINTPALICRILLLSGLKERQVYVGENLSYGDEKIHAGRPEDFLGLDSSPINMVVIADE